MGGATMTGGGGAGGIGTGRVCAEAAVDATSVKMIGTIARKVTLPHEFRGID